MERCRLCSFSGAEISVMKIFDEEGVLLKLRERIQNRLHIVIYECDFLPKIICRTCYGELEKYESFIEKAHKIQEIFLRGIQRNTAVPEKSTVLKKIKLEPGTPEEDCDNDICTEDSVDEVQEEPTEDEIDAMEFVEVNPTFIKMEESECPNDMEVENSRVISKSSRRRTNTESICLEENVSFDDERHDNGNEQFLLEKMDGSDEYSDSDYELKDLDDIHLDGTSPDIEGAKNIEERILPAKSKQRYKRCYLDFKKWRSKQKTSSISEKTILAYVGYLTDVRKIKPSSLWPIYSMLKTELNLRENANISKYYEVISFIKKRNDGYVPTRTKSFSEDELEKFIRDAQNYEYLDVKVACIFGLYGACRTSELVSVRYDHVQKLGNVFSVIIENTKTKIPRTFIINEEHSIIVEQYRALRPSSVPGNRFFVKYQRGKCLSQVIGKNKFANVPRIIATFLKLPDTQLYTGQAFRR